MQTLLALWQLIFPHEWVSTKRPYLKFRLRKCLFHPGYQVTYSYHTVGTHWILLDNFDTIDAAHYAIHTFRG